MSIALPKLAAASLSFDALGKLTTGVYQLSEGVYMIDSTATTSGGPARVTFGGEGLSSWAQPQPAAATAAVVGGYIVLTEVT